MGLELDNILDQFSTIIDVTLDNQEWMSHIHLLEITETIQCKKNKDIQQQRLFIC